MLRVSLCVVEAEMDATLARLERIAERLERYEEKIAVGTARSSSPAARQSVAQGRGMAPSTLDLDDWQRLVSEHLQPVVASSSGLSPEARQAAQHLEKGFLAVRGVLEAAGRSQPPDLAGLQQLLAPVAAELLAAGRLTEGRRTAAFNAAKLVAEALQALTWLAYTGPASGRWRGGGARPGMAPPGQVVADAWQAAEFYANKLVMEARGAGAAGAAEAAAAWVKAVKELMVQLEVFVRNHYPTGLRWGSRPSPSPSPSPSAPAPPPPAPPPPSRPSKGAPPPPPPGPPPRPLSVAALADSKGRAAGGGVALSALFKELQKGEAGCSAGAELWAGLGAALQGEAITQGLKKVTDDMKTKNRADRGEGRVALSSRPEPAAQHQGGSRGAGAAGAKAPRVHYDLQRKKWLVEHQVGVRGLVMQDVQANQGVYIFGCTDSLIQVPAKVNTISIDSCTKTGIVFGDLIGGCEVVNCRGLQLQCTGTVPTVSIEKTDGAQVFLTEQLSRNPAFQVVTAKCSEINVVVVPDAAAAEAGADSAEHAIPEQFISTFSPDGKLLTVAATHSGA
ncbi:hypothetical protein QJQ45_030512 [Haematococcus lacustris]|nr:hypothetical protein QJQ45_030512 [Haematococcus lacustris]